jgi:hypothetical protein
MSNFKNSETPANPTTPVNDQFGRTIMYLGFSKKEYIASKFFLDRVQLGMNKVTIDHIIHESYLIAEQFLNYEAETKNTPDIITEL